MATDPHPDVLRWARRLKRCIDAAPPGIEVLVGHGSLSICPKGTLHLAQDAALDSKFVDDAELESILGTHVLVPWGESL